MAELGSCGRGEDRGKVDLRLIFVINPTRQSYIIYDGGEVHRAHCALQSELHISTKLFSLLIILLMHFYVNYILFPMDIVR